jgi:hypothetical protein
MVKIVIFSLFSVLGGFGGMCWLLTITMRALGVPKGSRVTPASHGKLRFARDLP